MIQLVNSVLIDAVRRSAREVHFVPTVDTLKINYLIGTATEEVMDMPKALAPEIMKRIKVLAELDLTDLHQAHDGKFWIHIKSGTYKIHVEFTITARGETVVLQLTPEIGDARNPA